MINEMRVRKLPGSTYWVIEELVTIPSPFTGRPMQLWINHAAERSHTTAIAHADLCARTKAAAELQGAQS